MYWPLRARNTFMQICMDLLHARNSFLQFAWTRCMHAIPSCNLHGPVACTQFLPAICMDPLHARNSFMQFAWARCVHAIPSCNFAWTCCSPTMANT